MNYLKNETNIEFKEDTTFDNITRFPEYNIKIHKGVKIMSGTKIMEGVVIRDNVIIGHNCIIGNNSLIRNDVILGDKVKIGFSNSIETSAKIGDGTTTQGFCMISEFSVIGKNVFLAPMFNNPADRDCARFEGDYKPKPASIGDNVRIGSNVKLKPNIHIGNNAFIWMCAVVTKNVPENEEWAGFPAKKVEKTKNNNGNRTLANPLADSDIQVEIKGGGY